MIQATATSGELAKALGVTERVVAGRRQDGRLPTTSDDRIDVHAILKAGVEALARASKGEGVTLDAARIRVLTAQAEAREMLNAQMRAESVLAEDVEAICGAVVDSTRTKMLALPTKAGPLLAGMTSFPAIRDLLTGLVHDACGDLAATRIAVGVFERAKRRAGRGSDGDEDNAEVGSAT